MEINWEFVLNKDVLNVGLSFNLLSQINTLIDAGFSYNAGKLRRIPLQLDNTSYIPTIPFEDTVNNYFASVIKCKDKAIENAIDILIYLIKSFVFTNSNLNTTLVFINYYLIKSGLGYVNIPYEYKDELDKLCIELYEWNDVEKIKDFILNICYFSK